MQSPATFSILGSNILPSNEQFARPAYAAGDVQFRFKSVLACLNVGACVRTPTS
jgi:hypothetical protein